LDPKNDKKAQFDLADWPGCCVIWGMADITAIRILFLGTPEFAATSLKRLIDL